MSVVFISYSHTDSGTANAIVAALDDAGVKSFRDVKDIKWGDAISQSVRDGINKASAVIVILSPASLKSHWVFYEVGYATAIKKKVLPYLTHPELDPPAFIADLVNVKSAAEIKNVFNTNPDWAASAKSQVTEDDPTDAAFAKVAEMMPHLLREMKEDLSGDNPFIREFVPLEAGVTFNHSKPRFEYRDNVHEHLFNKVDTLETNGLVSVCHVTNYAKVYQFSEPFVERLLAWEPPKAN